MSEYLPGNRAKLARKFPAPVRCASRQIGPGCAVPGIWPGSIHPTCITHFPSLKTTINFAFVAHLMADQALRERRRKLIKSQEKGYFF